MDRIIVEGPARVSAGSTNGSRLCHLCGAKRRQGSGGKADERFPWRERDGNCCTVRRRHIARGLHGPLEGRRLRIARLSEKIQIRESYTKERNRPDSPAASNCRERAQKGRTEMKERKKTAKEDTIAVGSGNVFTDLGLPNPQQNLLKPHVTLQIYLIY